MAIQTKTIKQKMKSVQNIGKITKAMEMISVSKMKKSVNKRLASSVFAKHSFALLQNLYIHKNLTHPYLEKRMGSKTLMVIIASNKGLCGGYNMNVSKKVTQFIKANSDTKVEAIVVGKQAEKIARRNKISVVASFTEFSDYFTADEVRSFFSVITNTYNNKTQYTDVVVAYTDFVSALSFEAKIQNYIPLRVEEAGIVLGLDKSQNENKLFANYSFEPSEQEILESVVPGILVTLLYQLLLESLASEHSSRVTAMKNASDNAKDMLEDLKINYNRARQAAITQEIAEIVGGSSAMS
jgi:F-type H+-transporting ATPase subunit gamma